MPTCRTCKKELAVVAFKLRNGEPMKGCKVCNEQGRLARIKRLCPHKRQKSQCRECKGSSFCSHDNVKSKCKICFRKSNLQTFKSKINMQRMQR